MNLFTHVNATTIAEATTATAKAGTAPIAGGSDLLGVDRDRVSAE